MTIGTSYFVSLSAAVRYYKPYGTDKANVEQKIAEGEIHIGKPPVKPGEKLFKIDDGTRYAIENVPVPSGPSDGVDSRMFHFRGQSPLSRSQAGAFARYLKTQFPWLGTDDEANGADTVAELADVYQNLREFSR